jgi:hypothetical protein
MEFDLLVLSGFRPAESVIRIFSLRLSLLQRALSLRLSLLQLYLRLSLSVPHLDSVSLSPFHMTSKLDPPPLRETESTPSKERKIESRPEISCVVLRSEMEEASRSQQPPHDFATRPPFRSSPVVVLVIGMAGSGLERSPLPFLASSVRTPPS